MRLIAVAALTVLATAGCSASSSPDVAGSTSPATTSAAAPAAGPSSTPTAAPANDAFLAWAATHPVGQLDLPTLTRDHPATVADFGRGYCEMLSDAPSGGAQSVIQQVTQYTSGTPEQVREMVGRAVAAYCPEESRLLG